MQNRTQISVEEVFQILLQSYGAQGWWPLFDGNSQSCIYRSKPDKEFWTPARQWEVCVGCVLTQNTNWSNVERVFQGSLFEKLMNPEWVLECEAGELEAVIKSAGYFRQKSRYLKAIAIHLLDLEFDFRTNSHFEYPLERKDLLGVLGVGEETADSMLLYAFLRPEFIIDSYTIRIFSRLLPPSDQKRNYKFWKEFIETRLKPDVSIFQKYHALLVAHAKNFYLGRSAGEHDQLLQHLALIPAKCTRTKN